jgi:hypothetical protein
MGHIDSRFILVPAVAAAIRRHGQDNSSRGGNEVMLSHGTAHKYGDHIDTEVIIRPGISVHRITGILPHMMEDIDVSFVDKAKDGDIIVAGLISVRLIARTRSV